MPSLGTLLVSLIAVPFCFYMMAERRDENKVGDGHGKETSASQDSRSSKN